MTHTTRVKGPLWIALAFLLGTTPAAAQSRIAITPVTVVDVTDGSLAVDRTVLVEGNRIVAVDPAGRNTVENGWTVVDGAGGYLIPGLWDMHTHRSLPFFGLLIANGVTGVREMGGSILSLAEIEAVRREVLAGRKIGPRFIAAGPTVDTFALNNGTRVSATSPERGRWLVDSLSAAGADFIKVYELPRDTYFAIADQAVKRGIPIAGHLSDGVTLEEAARAGQRSVEHYTRSDSLGLLPMCSSQPDRMRRALEEINRLGVRPRDSVHLAHRREFMRLAVDTYDDERCRSTLRVLAGFETWHTPTLVMGMGYSGIHDAEMLRDPRLEYVSASRRERFETIREIYVSGLPESEVADFRRVIDRIIVNLQRAGVGLLAGSDVTGGFPPHGFSLHIELEELVSAGLTPLEALQTATLNPARFLRRGEELGAVEPGHLADLVLLDANPLEDIRNSRQIRAVVANGHLFRRADLDDMLAEVKRAVKE